MKEKTRRIVAASLVALLVIAVGIGLLLPSGAPSSVTLTIEGRDWRVHSFSSDPKRRFVPANRPALEPDEALLSSWDRPRHLHFFSVLARSGYDVLFLSEEGRVLERGSLPANHEEGLTSKVEAQRALFLPEGSSRLAVGDAVDLGPIRSRTPKPMPAVTVNGHEVRVEIAETIFLRTRGLMHRRWMSADDGMLFLFPREYPNARDTRHHSFWMLNCWIGLDIAYFDRSGKLVNVCSVDPAADPALQGASVTAPAEGPAQFVLEVNKGWFASRNLVDGKGRPVGDVIMVIPDAIRSAARESAERP